MSDQALACKAVRLRKRLPAVGEACAAVLMRAGVQPRFDTVAIPDEDTVAGAQADIFRHYGLSMEGLGETARALL